MPPIPKLRLMDRILAQDAAADDKMTHVLGQLKNLGEWTRTAADWMNRAEAVINKNTTDIKGLAGNRIEKPPGLDAELDKELKDKMARVDTLEEKFGNHAEDATIQEA